MRQMRGQKTRNYLRMVVDFIFYVEGIEKNREICIIVIQKRSGGVDGIRRAFRTQAKNYNGALFF